MNSDNSQALESNIPRRGRPRKNNVGSPPKSKPSLSGVRKLKPRAVKLVLPSVQAAVQNLAKVANKSTEIVKTFPIAPAKDSAPITTFLLTPADGKTGTLTPVSKSGSVPMTLIQQVTTSGATSIKQLPIGVSSSILPRVQVPSSTGSAPKLLLITTASTSALSVPITSTNQTLLPVKLGTNTSNSGPVVAGNLGKQVLYKIPSSQSSGMVLLSTTSPSQSGGPPKKYLLIPSSTTTKRQANTAVVLNSKISHSVDPNSDKPVFTITSPTQTACISTPNNSSKIPTTIVPISNLPETTSKKLTRQSAAKSSSPTKPVNTSRRRGSVLGANSTISSIPLGIFKTVACTTNSRGICSTPAGVQTSQTQSNVKLTQVGGLVSHGPLISAPAQQTSAFSQDVSSNMTIPTVPQASLKNNHLTSSSPCRISPMNISKPSQTPPSQSDAKLNPASESTPAKRSRPLPGRRAKKTIPKIDASGGATPSFITVPSSLPFSSIQLKPNSSSAALSASSFSGLSWLVSPNTGLQQISSPNSENGTRTKGPSISAKYKNMPKLIVVNGVSNGSFPATLSASSQTSNNDCKTGVFSANQYSKCSQNPRPIYASPPKLTIAPGFSPSDKNGSESGKKKRPSELMIIKEREEFIDDSIDLTNLDDLSPPKLQREDEPDLNGPFNFEMPPTVQSFTSAFMPLAKSTPTAQTKSNIELSYLRSPFSSSSSSMTNQYQSFCHDIKPIVRKDNFPTLASLSAMNTELISRLDKNRKLSFGQLFNHFKLLADKKKSKKASSHSAIMFQVAHSIHCCVVLTTMDTECSVDLNNLPFCVEESMKCSVKCRRTVMKESFAKKGTSPLLDPRFHLSILKSSDSTGERSSRCHPSKGPPNSSSANEIDSFSSTVTPGLFHIKTELPDYEEYPPDHQQQTLTNSTAYHRISTSGLTSEASTQKFATQTDESSSSFRSCSNNYDCRCSTQCISNHSSDCSKPKESTSTRRIFYSAVPKESSSSSNCCNNSSARGKKRGRVRLGTGKSKKAQSSLCSSERNTLYKIKTESNNPSELSSVLNVSSHSSSPQEFHWSGKLRYKIVLSGKSNSPEKESNCMDSTETQTRVPVQSYIISDDKTSINPIQTISPILAHPTKLHEDETKNLTESKLVGKRKRKQPQNHPGKRLPTKKINLTKTKETLPSKNASSPKKSAKGSCSKSATPAKPAKESSSNSATPKKSAIENSSKLTTPTKPVKESSSNSATPTTSTIESWSKSVTSAQITLPLVERPASLRDTKHLYDEPSTADRVVMLTPDGKPILKDADLQITFDVSSLNTPKKRRKPSKGKFPVKSSKTESPSPISKNPSPSSCDKGKVQGKHSKRPPTLNFLLREITHKSKCKYLPSSSLKKTPTKKKNSCPKTYLGSAKSKKASIEKIVDNISPSSLIKTPTKKNDSACPETYLGSAKSKKENVEQIVNNIASGFPAFGPGSPRCTMKLYKYFVSTRIKNRAKKNGSHEIDAPLTLYINWKTISRQPFRKHRITNHALNVNAIKKAKQFSNYKKCKSRSRMCKPVKNRPLFMTRRKGFPGSKAKTKSNKKSTKKINKKPSKLLQQRWPSKKKTQIRKTLSSAKKKAQAPILPCSVKTEEIIVKTEPPSSPDLAPIVERGNSKTLVNKKNAGKKKTLKSSSKKPIDLPLVKQEKPIDLPLVKQKKPKDLPLVKQRKQINEKRATKKALRLTRCSSLPAIRTTRSRVVLPETENANFKKVGSLCETPSQIKTEPEESDTRTTKLNQQEILNEQTYSNDSPPPHTIQTFEDKDLPSKSKSEVADLIAQEKITAADTKPDIPNSQLDLKENDSNSSPSGIVDSPIPSDSINIANSPIPSDSINIANSPIPSDSINIANSPIPSDSINIANSPIPSDSINIEDTPIPSDSINIKDTPIPSDSINVKAVAVLPGKRSQQRKRKNTSSIRKRHSKVPAQPADAPQLPVSEKEEPNIETPTQALSPVSASNPADDENAEVATQQQLASPSIREDSGNFIFEDDIEPSLPIMDITPSSCNQDRHLNSMHSSSFAADNQPVISNTNSNTPFTNVTPTIRSSAFSDRFDIGLSPELARIQRLKDQLQEKQKALDLAKLYLK